MTSTSDTIHRWGIPAPEGMPGASWGARALYSLDTRSVDRRRLRGRRYVMESVTEVIATVDLLWDRQSVIGGSPDERAALLNWLNTKGLPCLRERCSVARLRPDSRDEIRIEEDGYVLVASPRRSHGYLYIGAWQGAISSAAATQEDE